MIILDKTYIRSKDKMLYLLLIIDGIVLYLSKYNHQI
jgi:hypothetical protein